MIGFTCPSLVLPPIGFSSLDVSYAVGTTYYMLHNAYCMYYILYKQLACNVFTLQHTDRLPKCILNKPSLKARFFLLLLLFYFPLNFNNKCPVWIGCEVVVHCILGNSRRGRQVGYILGTSSESVEIWEIFSILQILLVFTYSILYTTFGQISMYC